MARPEIALLGWTPGYIDVSLWDRMAPRFCRVLGRSRYDYVIALIRLSRARRS